jgi:hypothetical protein
MRRLVGSIERDLGRLTFDRGRLFGSHSAVRGQSGQRIGQK